MRLSDKAAIVEQVLTLTAVQSATFSTTPDLVTAMLKEASKLRKELEDTVREVLIRRECTSLSILQDKSISDLEKVTNKGFDKSEGPFVKALDAALASFHVERQAYYSGTFVGNHVHRCLKVKTHT